MDAGHSAAGLSLEAPVNPPFPDMVWIPGGQFHMGSDKHYREERPVHRVSVDGFWIDRFPVTNARFQRFVDATSHVTYAEIPPRAEDYPGALPEMLYAGSLVFLKPPGPGCFSCRGELVALRTRSRLAPSSRCGELERSTRRAPCGARGF